MAILTGKWMDLGPLEVEWHGLPARSFRLLVPGALVVWFLVAVMVVAGLGWAVPALASPDNPTAATRPDDMGDENGRGVGDGSGSGQGPGVGRGNGDTPTTTGAPSATTSTTAQASTTGPTLTPGGPLLPPVTPQPRCGC